MLTLDRARVLFPGGAGAEVSLHVPRGGAVGLVGSSGSGKTLTALAVMGLLPHDARVSGVIRCAGRRGMVFQDPAAALNPVMRVGAQIGEGRPGLDVAARLAEVGLPASYSARYPHQLSGGQQQRVVLAIALAGDPDLLIADEPTTALDTETQGEILALLRELRRRRGMALLYISHDLEVVRALTDTIVAIGPRVDAPPLPAVGRRTGEVVMDVRELGAGVVDGVSFQLRRGCTLGIVGPSGVGKTTIARALLRLVPARGHVWFGGLDWLALRGEALRRQRRRVQLVFQDPLGALDPRLRVRDVVERGLEEVGLGPELLDRRPHELSGGQRQRLVLARALAVGPEVLVLDEPVSALDAGARTQVLLLIQAIQSQRGLACLFIGHDRGVVEAMADEVVELRRGGEGSGPNN